jgi:hypothetical protein
MGILCIFMVIFCEIYFFQEQRIHPGAPIDVSLSPTPSEIARLPTGKSPVFQTIQRTVAN